MEELENATEDMVVAKFKRVFEVDGHEEERDETRILKKLSGTFDDVELTDWFTMHAVIYRTALLQENHINITEHCFYTDQEYDLLPIQYVNTIRKLPYCLYCYRIGRAEQSVSPAGMEKHYKEQMKVFKKMFSIYSETEKPKNNKDFYIRYYLTKRLRIYLKAPLVISPTKEHKEEIRQFCRYCKQTVPEIFNDVIHQSRVIKLLVLSNFLCYNFLHNREKNKLNNYIG